MKMKLIICLVIFFFIFVLIKSNTTESSFNLQNHLSMMMKFKSKTNIMLKSLYISANRVEKTKTKTSKKQNKQNTFTNKKPSQNKNKKQNKQAIHHFSNIKAIRKQVNLLRVADYQQYRYLSYEEIVNTLYDLQRKYPNYLKIDTAQNLYKLPHPGGYCHHKMKM